MSQVKTHMKRARYNFRDGELFEYTYCGRPLWVTGKIKIVGTIAETTCLNCTEYWYTKHVTKRGKVL